MDICKMGDQTMIKKMKRPFALFMAFLMVLSVLTLTGFAMEQNGEDENKKSEQVVEKESYSGSKLCDENEKAKHVGNVDTNVNNTDNNTCLQRSEECGLCSDETMCDACIAHDCVVIICDKYGEKVFESFQSTSDDLIPEGYTGTFDLTSWTGTGTGWEDRGSFLSINQQNARVKITGTAEVGKYIYSIVSSHITLSNVNITASSMPALINAWGLLSINLQGYNTLTNSSQDWSTIQSIATISINGPGTLTVRSNFTASAIFGNIVTINNGKVNFVTSGPSSSLPTVNINQFTINDGIVNVNRNYVVGLGLNTQGNLKVNGGIVSVNVPMFGTSILGDWVLSGGALVYVSGQSTMPTPCVGGGFFFTGSRPFMDGMVIGDPILNCAFMISAGQTITIPTGRTLTTRDDFSIQGKLVNNGTLNTHGNSQVSGELHNIGTINCHSAKIELLLNGNIIGRANLIGVQFPQNLTAYTHQRLSDVLLPNHSWGQFSWQNDITSPVGAIGSNNHLLTFNPNNTDVYKPISQEVTVTVNQLQHSITWHAGGGSPEPTQTTVDHNETIIAPPPMTKTGYTFDGWFRDAEFTQKAMFPLNYVTTPHSFYARWIENITITVGVQVNQVFALPGGEVKFPVFTTGIACGLHKLQVGMGSIGVLDGSINIEHNMGDLILDIPPNIPVGVHAIQVSFAGVTSNEFFLNVQPLTLGNVTITIDAPKTGAIPQTSITEGNYFTGNIQWYDVTRSISHNSDENLQRKTVYRATVELVTKPGAIWSINPNLVITVFGHEFIRGPVTIADSSSTLTFSVTFAATLCDHNLVWVPIEYATCTTEGWGYYSCRYEDCDYTEAPRAIPALGHSWGEWVVLNPPTCLTAGSRIRYCTRSGCNKYEEEPIPATGHTPGEWITLYYPTCITSGLEEKRCIICDVIIDEQSLDPLGHAFSGCTSLCSREGCSAIAPPCGICFMCDPEIIDIPPTVFKVIEDFNVWTGEGDATAIINANPNHKLRVLIDGDVVDPSNYTVSYGSTMITLHDDFLDTLDCGIYLVRTEFVEGHAYKTLVIERLQTGNGNDNGTGNIGSDNNGSDSNGTEENSTNYNETNQDKKVSTYRTSPRTEDMNTVGIWVAFLSLSSITIIILTSEKLKAKKHNKS